jgi:hypothetical protein
MFNSRTYKGLLGLPLAGLICLIGAWSLSAAPAQERAQDGRAAAPQADHEEEEEEHSPLQLGMKNLQRSMKAMRSMLGEFDVNQAAIITVLESMEKSVVEGLTQPPPRPEDKMNDSEWAQYQVTFRQKLTTSLSVILEMELAAHKGDGETVVAKYRSLNRLKKDGHGTHKLD